MDASCRLLFLSRAHPHCVRPQVQLHTASRRCAAFDRPPSQFSPLKSASCLASHNSSVAFLLFSRFVFGGEEKKWDGIDGGFKDRAVSRPLLGFCSPLSIYLSLLSFAPFFRPFGIGNGGYKEGGFKGALYTWARTFSPFLFTVTRRFLSVVNFQLSPILWQFWKF